LRLRKIVRASTTSKQTVETGSAHGTTASRLPQFLWLRSFRSTVDRRSLQAHLRPPAQARPGQAARPSTPVLRARLARPGARRGSATRTSSPGLSLC